MEPSVPDRPEDGSDNLTLFGIDPMPDDPTAGQLLRRAGGMGGLRTLALVLITVATGLYLLERLEPVLRPLLIAALLCYLLLPLYAWLRRYMRPVFSFLIIVGGITLGLQGVARMVYRDVVLIDRRLPQYLKREAELENHVRELSKSLLPRLQRPRPADPAAVDDSLTNELSQRIVRSAAGVFMNVFLESIVVAFYMIFLLQSASKLPRRIRTAFSSERSHAILEVTTSINRAISDYLLVKVKASLLVSIPIALACWAFGITGAVTWGTITFFGNFLPYVGALVAIVPPVLISFLEFTSLWPPVVFTLVVLLIHGLTANLIEPAMTGKALGLSPLIVLIGLAFWSLLWGFVGMVLAVPLTVIFKIVLEHTPATRPLARMISEDE
ncbi:MAG: AI-2E family transporter [Isosphaeraceae bacterium]